jgi:hypothetical protein
MSDPTHKLTPKGMFCALISKAVTANPSSTTDYADEQWLVFEAMIIRRLREQDPEAPFAALVFDGAGGEVIGAAGVDDV